MSRFFVLILCLAPIASAQNTDGLEQLVPKLMSAGDVPGLSLAVVRDGKLALARGWGVKNAETRVPADENAVFEAGSLTKPVFAYAVLKLADAGKIDLDAPISRYLPNYIPDERVNQITARHVLSHTTGFPNWRSGELKINFNPGERFGYSGEGFVYLQKAVEKITGIPAHELVAREVFGPLGMKHSSFVWQERLDAQLAAPHDLISRPRPTRKRTEANAAASLLTTAPDFARFLIALMNGAGLKKETVRQMFAPQSKVAENVDWGLGIGTERTKAGDTIWHWGDNGDFKCFAIAYPARKAAMVAFTNSTNGLSIMPELVAHVFPGERPALAYLKYARYDSPLPVLFRLALDKGGAAAAAELRKAEPADYRAVGYSLLAADRPDDAVEIFKALVDVHPDSRAHADLERARFEAGAYDVSVERDVAYGADELQKLDIYRPKDAGSMPRGAVLFLHGGAWRGGSKTQFAWHGRDLASRGLVAFSAGYRLAPQHRYPAAFEDAQSAVRRVREHAAEYGVDPKRVCAVGSSAGGHLVALLGWAEASPITHLSKESSPVLVIHGTADQTVPIEQSEFLITELKAAGVEAELLRIDGAAHGFHNKVETADAKRAWKAALGFLRRHLSLPGMAPTAQK